jgi:hypothetical protein
MRQRAADRCDGSVEELGAGSSDGVVVQAARRDGRGLGFKARLSAA